MFLGAPALAAHHQPAVFVQKCYFCDFGFKTPINPFFLTSRVEEIEAGLTQFLTRFFSTRKGEELV